MTKVKLSFTEKKALTQLARTGGMLSPGQAKFKRTHALLQRLHDKGLIAFDPDMWEAPLTEEGEELVASW